MPVVVVESPAKAKTINKYLGSNYTVLASYGHVRDLPPKDGSVLPEEDFDMKWEIASDSKKHIKAIVDALKDDNELILATDPDREGEAISWHLTEALIAKKAIKKDTPVSRVVFNAITKDEIERAFSKPRAIDLGKVNAQQARRFLDRVVGYMVSPLLWAKVARGLSAGRVQSVAVRLVVEREREIHAFVPEEYWEVHADLVGKQGDKVTLFLGFGALLAPLALWFLVRRSLATGVTLRLALFPEAAFGPALNSVGIGQALGRRFRQVPIPPLDSRPGLRT